jgi:hypothetical protein
VFSGNENDDEWLKKKEAKKKEWEEKYLKPVLVEKWRENQSVYVLYVYLVLLFIYFFFFLFFFFSLESITVCLVRLWWLI